MTTTMAVTSAPRAEAGSGGRAGRIPRRGGGVRGLLARVAVGAFHLVVGWFPVTPFGLLAIVGLVVAARAFSGVHPDLIVLTIVFAGLLLCVLNVLMVIFAAGWLWLRRRAGESGERLELETSVSTPTGYRLGPIGWNPLLSFEVHWIKAGGVEAALVSHGAGWREEARARERGRADGFVRRVTVRDWFGLSRVWFQVRVERPLRCLPWCGKTAVLELIEQFRPGDVLGHPEGQPVGDLVEMRRYVAGDPLKLVLWKAYARTGRMLVRTQERAVTPTTRTLAYLIAAEGDDPAAGIALGLLDAGLLGEEVVFMADGAEIPARDRAEWTDQILRSIDARDRGGENLERFLVQGEAGGTSAAILFVSPLPGPWLERVCATLSGHPGPFRAVIGVDGVREGSDGRWRAWLRQPAGDGRASATGLRRVRDRLVRAGVEVLVIQRATGEVLQLKT